MSLIRKIQAYGSIVFQSQITVAIPCNPNISTLMVAANKYSLAYKLSKEKVFKFWGLLDAIYIFWYAWGYPLQLGKIPFYINSLTIAGSVQFVGLSLAYVWLASTLLHASILVSAAMLLTSSSKAKLLCYIQLPFRLFLIVPSVSIISIIAAQTEKGMEQDVGGTVVLFTLLALSEMLKVYTLWKAKD